jgi:hypothetical protein
MLNRSKITIGGAGLYVVCGPSVSNVNKVGNVRVK